MPNFITRHKNKKHLLTYHVSMVHSCCGMSLIHNLKTSSLGFESQDIQLLVLKRFSKYLTTDWYKRAEEGLDLDTIPYNLLRSKLVIADAVGGEYGEHLPSLWKMCHTNKAWEQIGTPVLNRNSNNFVVLFEFNEPPEDRDD